VTLWLQELDGIEFAGFWSRAIALTIDATLSGIALSLIAVLLSLGYLGVRKRRSSVEARKRPYICAGGRALLV
jgi:hypothetical protein